MRNAIKEQSMIAGLVLCTVCLIAAAIVVTDGCGETNDDRRQISQHTKDLAAIVKGNPDSQQGQAAMNELIEILNGKWRFARCQACYVLDDLGPLAAPALPHLMKAAQSGEMFIAQDAVRGMRSIGPAAAPAVDLLTGMVDTVLLHPNENAPLRVLYALEALGNIGEAALKSVPSLERASQSHDRDFAEEAEKALTKLGAIETKLEQSENHQVN